MMLCLVNIINMKRLNCERTVLIFLASVLLISIYCLVIPIAYDVGSMYKINPVFMWIKYQNGTNVPGSSSFGENNKDTCNYWNEYNDINNKYQIIIPTRISDNSLEYKKNIYNVNILINLKILLLLIIVPFAEYIRVSYPRQRNSSIIFMSVYTIVYFLIIFSVVYSDNVNQTHGINIHNYDMSGSVFFPINERNHYQFLYNFSNSVQLEEFIGGYYSNNILFEKKRLLFTFDVCKESNINVIFLYNIILPCLLMIFTLIISINISGENNKYELIS